MRLRDGVMRRFGVKTSDDMRGSGSLQMRVDFFPVLCLRENEIVLGDDDRHLDFRLSLKRQRDEDGEFVVATTVVRTHNWLGRAYLLAVFPVHGIVARASLSRLARTAATDVDDKT